MNELKLIEFQMRSAIAMHKVRMLEAVAQRLTQLGFRFSSPESMEDFFKKKVCFIERPHTNITEVHLEGDMGSSFKIMEHTSFPEVDIVDD